MTGAAGLRSALLLHGAGGGSWEWNVWRGVLQAGGLQVVAPDLRPATTGVAATRLDDYLAQAAAELDRLPPPCVVIGASLGGLLAAQLARHAAALVLVNPVPAAPWHGALRARERPAVVPWRRQARLESTRAALPGADTATALFAFRRWRDESGAALREAHAGIHVPRPACHVLCIASLCDDDVPAAATEAWAQAWQADLMRLDRSGHVDPLLGAEAAPLASRVLAWLSAR